MVARKYNQRLRAEAAEETRRRILDAVYERMHDEPSRPVSVDQVARRAGVSRSTVYVIFGSRAGLFDAFGVDLLQRGGLDRLTEAVAHPDAREHLRGGMRAGVDMLVPHRDVLRVLFSTASIDGDAVGGAVSRMNERRRGGVEYLAQRLADQDVLRPDVSVADAVDLLWVLTSFDTFDQLYTERSLPAGEVARILTATAERSLCRSEGVESGETS